MSSNSHKTPPLGGKGGFAVMDLGTNTFHLLIAEPDAHTFFKETCHSYVGVKLGEGGINEGTIKPEAYKRGIDALVSFHKLIEQHSVNHIKAIATSAMRSASNGQQFMDEVKQRTRISIETISGDTEAGYIYQGVKASGCLASEKSLIVDIGGGSVEFILCDDQRIYYKQSFEIGAARLMAKFHKTDPIAYAEIEAMNEYLDEKLAPLFEALTGHDIKNIVGSSGAFETFAELVETDKGYIFDLNNTITYHFKNGDLLNTLNKLVESTHNERLETKGIIPVRIDMIVVASLLTRYLINRLQINDVTMTAYSLKEGVLAELFGN